MSRAQRRALVERETPTVPIVQQCRLLAVSRASVYRKPAELSAEDLAIMALIDRIWCGPITARGGWQRGWRPKATL
jgi:putative transposase